jgi:hypothetical protein
MANITWADRTDATTATGATTEWSKDQANPLKAWANSPMKALGTFAPAMTFADQGNYSDYTASGDVAFSATGIVAGNVRKVKITTDGTHTFSAGTGCRLLSGSLGKLAAGTYDVLMASFDTNEVLLSIPASSTSTIAPHILFMSVEDANPNSLVVVFNEAVTATNIGYTFRVNSTPRTLSGISGSGTNTLTFTISSTAIANGDVLDLSYDSSLGDTLSAASSLELESITQQAVTNNVGVSYDTDAAALFTRMATAGSEPNATRKGHINTLITTLKTDGNWTELDCLQVYAAHSSLVYLLNWKADEFNGSAIGSPSVTLDQYFAASTGNAVDSGFNPNLGTKYGLNDAALGVYLAAHDSTYSALKVFAGVNDGSNAAFIGAGATNGYFTGRINLSSPSMNPSDIVLDNTIHSVIRTAASASELKQNNAQIDTDTTAATGLPNANIYVGGLNLTGLGFESASQFKVFFAGSSSINLSLLKTALDTYLTGI